MYQFLRSLSKKLCDHCAALVVVLPPKSLALLCHLVNLFHTKIETFPETTRGTEDLYSTKCSKNYKNSAI